MFGGDTFEDPYDLTDAVLRVKAHQYMDVVPVITKLFNRQVIPLFKASHSLTHSGDNFSAQKCLTILHGEDEVVVGVVRAVVTLGDGHPTSIAAFERNLRFPSNSPPLKEPRGRDHGENADFTISTPAFLSVLERVNPSFSYESKSLLRKDSTDITTSDRDVILAACRDSSIDKIIITHGTDTMIDTARSLQAITNKTIVLTGAFTPEQFRVSDTDFNLGAAIGAVQSLDYGVYIAMNGNVLSCDESIFDNDLKQFTSKSQKN